MGNIFSRSSYHKACGGKICLGRKMLQTLKDYAKSFWDENGKAIRVNSLAGSSHSYTSLHYQGGVWDVDCKNVGPGKDPTTSFNHCAKLVKFCRFKSLSRVVHQP